ncbi:hypothetical protein RD792_011564 [Penstemon davidsonii]|uniref:Uncharacterized protein n=1 Tax=Penstemon davidsonii TaxID=160366 RepID=A0ABR0CYF3_9LAMI|nr:hypothetical protein RD792_011564 [Penstemon davidsonii]
MAEKECQPEEVSPHILPGIRSGEIISGKSTWPEVVGLTGEEAKIKIEEEMPNGSQPSRLTVDLDPDHVPVTIIDTRREEKFGDCENEKVAVAVTPTPEGGGGGRVKSRSWGDNVVRIAVDGKPGTEKLSLIEATINNKFRNFLPQLLQPSRLIVDLDPGHVPVTIIDTRSDNNANIVDALSSVDAVVLTYSSGIEGSVPGQPPAQTDEFSLSTGLGTLKWSPTRSDIGRGLVT